MFRLTILALHFFEYNKAPCLNFVFRLKLVRDQDNREKATGGFVLVHM